MMRLTPFERRSLLLLLLLIALTVGGGWWWRHHRAQQPVDAFSDSLLSEGVDSLQTSAPSRPKRYGNKRSSRRQVVGDTLFAFDPNRCDSASLVRLGFSPWMARNILRYRAKGGRFRRAEELRKLYGMTDSLYTRIAPYVAIAPSEQHRSAANKPNAANERSSVYLSRTDSLSTRTQKYPKGTRIELNRCDTNQLKKIPGIGSYTARRIVSYRERLGGFVRMEQLREIRLNNDVLAPWFTLDTTAVTPLQVNHLPMKQLLAHPYLNYRQSRAIVLYRERYGPLSSIQVMHGWEEFTANELRRVAPYLSFE